MYTKKRYTMSLETILRVLRNYNGVRHKNGKLYIEKVCSHKINK